MSERTGQVRRRFGRAVGTGLAAVIFCARAFAEPGEKAGAARSAGGVDKSNPYSLGYSQISAAAGTSSSADYTVEHSVRFPAATGRGQRSSEYGVVNPQGNDTIKANNGVAIVIGTKVRIVWPEARGDFGTRTRAAGELGLKPGLASGPGYQVRRSGTGAIGSYVAIGPALIFETEYSDENLARGTYYYRVFYFDGQAIWFPWTPPLMAVITEGSNPAQDWMFYD